MIRALSLVLLLSCAAFADEAGFPLSGIEERHLGLLKQYCLDCHNAKKSKGKFRIDELALVIQGSPDAERWQKVLNALNAGEMPPDDEEQLPAKEKADLVDDLGQAMVALRRKMSDRHGQIAMGRLNRREYRNTLRELLGVEINVSQLPADQGLSNFDTNGASLYVSSNQLESYLELGREAVEEAIDRYEARDNAVSHRHEAEELTAKYRAHFAKRDAAIQWRSDLAEAGFKPENKAIFDALKEKHPKSKDIYLPFYLHYDEIAGAPPVPADEAFRFYDKPIRVHQFITGSSGYQSYLGKYLDLPAIETGAFITVPTLHPSIVPTGHITYQLPANWPPGKYKVRFRAARADDAPDDRRFVEFGLRVRNVDLLSAHEVTGTMDNPQIIETSIEITRKHLSGQGDERQIYIRERAMHHQFHYTRKIFNEAKKRNGWGPEYVFWIDWLELERITTADEPIPPALQTIVELLDYDARSADDSFIHPTGGVSGRKVRIFNPDSGSEDYLHLREVRVMSGGKNVALEGKATQSSTHGSEADRGAQRAIDGDLATYNHSSNAASPGEWWEVDLGQDCKINEIVIFNRNDSDSVKGRLKNYRVEILDANGDMQWQNRLSAKQLGDRLRTFATAAFRGDTPDDAFIDRLLSYYEDKRQIDGESHRAALTQTLAIVLSSPMFLYKSESSLQIRQAISQRELAQRLAYFLWSAPADAALLQLADTGKLSDPEVLRQETDRLLDDPRSEAMIHGLVHQWLDLERLDFFNVNLVKHRSYDNSVKMAVRDEVYETTAYLLAENRSIRDLLSADYAVINNLLAEYYGLPAVSGDHFRPVKLPESSPRGGLLGMAAIHLMGGNGDESSPVERGAWVLRKLMHQPPPPAPANVPNLARLSDKLLTTRERLLAHQEVPQCASCHRKIDPIGFGLENFDAVGLWRSEDSYATPGKDGQRKTWAIDPSGRFHKGAAFADYFELRAEIASQPDEFATSFASAVLEYGMGRATGFSDQGLIDAIVKHAKAENYSTRSFFHALVQRKGFSQK